MRNNYNTEGVSRGTASPGQAHQKQNKRTCSLEQTKLTRRASNQQAISGYNPNSKQIRENTRHLPGEQLVAKAATGITNRKEPLLAEPAGICWGLG